MKKTAMTSFIIGIIIFLFVLPASIIGGHAILFNLATTAWVISSVVFWISILKIVLDKLTK